MFNAQHFLQGTGKYTVGMILECWLKSADGHYSNGSFVMDLMYSTSTLYTEIRTVHTALTSFAVQGVCTSGNWQGSGMTRQI